MSPSTFDNRPVPAARRKMLLLSVGAVTLTGVAVLWWVIIAERPFEQVLDDAQAAFAQGDFQTAQRLANGLLKRTPDSSSALLVNGQASIELGRCTEGELLLRRVLRQDGSNVDAHSTLVRLLKVEGRFRDLLPHAQSLLRSGDSGGEFLIPLAAPDGITLSDGELQRAKFFGESVPHDPSPLLGVARHFLQNAETERAIAILQQIVESNPENITAQALRGIALLELDDADQFRNWHQQLPSAAESHPEIWFLRGAWARRGNSLCEAIRCCLEAVMRDPNHRRANLFLSQLFVAVGEADKATPFAERFERLEEVDRLATRGDDFSGDRMTARTMHRIAVLMESLGRLWEAAGWSRQAIQRDAEFSEARRLLDDLTSRIDDATPLTLHSSNPARTIDLSIYPLPDWSSDELREPSPRTSSAQNATAQILTADKSIISFSDKAESLGLKFRFHNGANPESGRARMFEFSGGGVAVVDYDGDFWPDLYLTQGSPWPETSADFRDSLFRNVDGESFENVADKSDLSDERYGQGATTGDFDNDGFSDMHLANIGKNRLYRNNGDGTFTDVFEDAETGGNEWTSSGVLADVNGDSLPDLYCVNYLGGDDVFDRACHREGRPVQCPLHFFPSAQDRLYLNLGDGRFQETTETSGIAIPDGKGMGIVAANFHRSDRLSLFVANDDKPNFFFVDQASRTNAAVSYSEIGVRSGLAFGEFGTSQSCMGIAAGDANNDGLLDLFVTNFTGEPDNLFVHKPGVIFEDLSRQSGLHLATLQPMGWGTQFVDGDLDGLLDLIVANGHLDENTSGNLPYRMRTQFFRNLGEHRFDEVMSDQLGPYFERKRAGRAVARIDWNRDGADDVCITHVDTPTALLSNETAHRGHHLSVRLRGVACSRDAIGSVVRATVGGESWFRHLTAGDGFQSSNERKLSFGFGTRKRIDELTIYWPSGFEQTLPGPKLDTDILIIEGQEPRTSSKQRHATPGQASD
jgi:tetratricopeptide (TPR) repeat protein